MNRINERGEEISRQRQDIQEFSGGVGRVQTVSGPSPEPQRSRIWRHQILQKWY